MDFPILDPVVRLRRLEPPAPENRVRMVLDTDTFNEIDDQYALVYALLSPERLDVEAIYAAPFHNARSSSPHDGMEKSYDEILALLSRLDRSPDGFVHKGSTHYLRKGERPEESAAATDLVDRAMKSPSDEPLYVVAIGAITNVASAILLEPKIIEKIVVVWLGGHALHWPNAREFNLHQDVSASQLIFDCGVPLVHIPCAGVTSHLLTTVSEIDAHVRDRGAIGAYLADIFKEYSNGRLGWSKVLWDVATIAYLIDHTWVPTELRHSPILTEQCTWSVDASRHVIRYARFVQRDSIFGDLFQKLASI